MASVVYVRPSPSFLFFFFLFIIRPKFQTVDLAIALQGALDLVTGRPLEDASNVRTV